MGFRSVDAELEVELDRGKRRLTKHRGGKCHGASSQHPAAGHIPCFHYCFSPKRSPRLWPVSALSLCDARHGETNPSVARNHFRELTKRSGNRWGLPVAAIDGA